MGAGCWSWSQLQCPLLRGRKPRDLAVMKVFQRIPDELRFLIVGLACELMQLSPVRGLRQGCRCPARCLILRLRKKPPRRTSASSWAMETGRMTSPLVTDLGCPTSSLGLAPVQGTSQAIIFRSSPAQQSPLQSKTTLARHSVQKRIGVMFKAKMHMLFGPFSS